MSLNLPIYLNSNSTEADLRAAIAHGDTWPESRAWIIKVVTSQCERPDLIPYEWPERTITPISASGVSWLLPNADGNVNHPVSPAPVDIVEITGLTASAGESVVGAIRAMRASLAGVPDEIERQRATEQHRAARRRRVHGGQA